MVQTPKKSRRDAEPSLRDRAEALRARMPGREVDPVLAVIKDGRRLLEACRRAGRLSGTVEGLQPAAYNEAVDDLFEHLRETVLHTPPETPVGAVALAKYAVEFKDIMGTQDLSEEIAQVLRLIAEVQLA